MFGAFAGYTYWFPKAFGFRLHDGLGKAVFGCWFVGFWLAFMPLYALGLMGATRRMQHYAETEWQPLMIVAFVGALVILCGIVLTVVQLVVSIRARERLRDTTGDPWDGRTLEWSTPFAAAALELRGAAAGRRPRRVLGGEALQRRRAGRRAGRGRQAAGDAAAQRARHSCSPSSPSSAASRWCGTSAGSALRWAWSASSRPCLARAWQTEHEFEVTPRPNRRVRGVGERAHERRRRAGPPRPSPDLRARPVAAQGDRRLRLLAVPAQRHHRVLGAVRGLCGAVRPHRRRAGRRAAVPPRQRADRDGLPAAVELHVRDDVAGHRAAPPRPGAGGRPCDASRWARPSSGWSSPSSPT